MSEEEGTCMGLSIFVFLSSSIAGIHRAAEHVFLRKQTKNLVLRSS